VTKRHRISNNSVAWQESCAFRVAFAIASSSVPVYVLRAPRGRNRLNSFSFLERLQKPHGSTLPEFCLESRSSCLRRPSRCRMTSLKFQGGCAPFGYSWRNEIGFTRHGQDSSAWARSEHGQDLSWARSFTWARSEGKIFQILPLQTRQHKLQRDRTTSAGTLIRHGRSRRFDEENLDSVPCDGKSGKFRAGF